MTTLNEFREKMQILHKEAKDQMHEDFDNFGEISNTYMYSSSKYHAIRDVLKLLEEVE